MCSNCVFKMLLILYKGYSRNGKGFDWLLDSLCIWWLHYQGLTQLWSLLSKARLITLGLWLISSSMQCTVPISVAKLCLATLQPDQPDDWSHQVCNAQFQFLLQNCVWPLYNLKSWSYSIMSSSSWKKLI